MAPTTKHVVFDVVGTCISYDVFFEAITTRLGPKLLNEGIKPSLLGYAWMEAAEREYTYLSISGKYTPLKVVLASLFYRMLHFAGISERREFASDDDLAYITSQHHELKARPGIHECFEKLRAAGFTIWAFTAGDVARVSGYLDKACINLPSKNFMSCDTLGVGKPAMEAYKPILEEFAGEEAWFAAAHMWDVSAAKRSGFRGAWCSAWEKEACLDLFGAMDVMSDTLPEMADKIIAMSAAGCQSKLTASAA